MFRYSLFAFLCCLLFQSTAQTQGIETELKIGQWRQHLPWQQTNYVTQSEDKVFFTTDLALLELDKADRSTRFLTKVEGLSDIGMGIIRYSKSAKTLIVTYSNSNIDLVKGEAISNLPVISKNANIIGDKQIYDIAFSGKLAYFACGFGVMTLDLEREEVVNSTFTQMPVLAINIHKGQVLVGTEDGIFSIAQSDQNPEDFTRWHKWGMTEGLPSAYRCQAIGVKNDVLYLGMGSKVSIWENNALSLIAEDATFEVLYITTEGESIVMGFRKDFNGRVVYRSQSGQQNDIQFTCSTSRPIYCIEDGAKTFWFADFLEAFKYYDLNTDQCEALKFNSPKNQKVKDIEILNNTVYVTTPGPESGLAGAYIRDGVFVYKDGTWITIDNESQPDLIPDDCDRDMWRLAAHPDGEKVYIGSYIGGLVEFENDAVVECFTQKNSILQGAGASGANLTAIGGLAFDSEKNLWISNFNADRPIAVLKADGTFRNFTAPVKPVLQVEVDRNNYKWFVLGFNNGILIYDSGADLDSPSDDRFRTLSPANTVLPTNTVNCLAVDRSGDVWVGTQQGVVSFECGSNMFDNQCRGSRRIIEVDGFNGYLLETEDVRAIAVDGANRKWFGTTNGIFVQSPNGETLIANYTTSNSPLFDNEINAIAINPINGEVWVGSEKGVQSFRAEATEGTAINSRNVYAYPNPVRPGYEGPIAIYGLASDANVKITDISGQLVYEGTATGGQAIWNGQDYLGRKAASGVYLVFATSDSNFDVPDAIVAKVVVVR